MNFSDQVIGVTCVLSRDAIPHAFGGAVALRFYTPERETRDIDVGIYLPPTDHPRVLLSLGSLFSIADAEQVALVIERDGQVRLKWGETPIDLFFSYDPFHESNARRVRRVAYFGQVIPIVSAEDLIVHKIAFNRDKDWRDIGNILYVQAGAVDLTYIRRWLQHLFPGEKTDEAGAKGSVDEHVRRFEHLVGITQRAANRETP
jgi:hypothetical protein